MASVLSDLQSDLFDPKAYMDGFKAAGGGAAAIVATQLAVNRLPFIKDQSPLIKQAVAGALSIVAGVAAERYIGREAAYGMIGGGAGHAAAKIVNQYLPAQFQLSGDDDLVISGDETDVLASVEVEQGSLADVTVEQQLALADGEDDMEFADLSAVGLAAVI